MGRVLVVGSLNVDLVVPVERLPAPGETVLATGGVSRYAGGKGGNQAIAAAETGARVVMIGAVGDDEPGRAYSVRLSSRGVYPRLAVMHGQWTGMAQITREDSGEVTIIVQPGANLSARADVNDITAGDVLLCQLEIPLPVVTEAVTKAAAAGARVVINASPYAVLPAEVIAVADPLVVNEHEALALADSGVLPKSLLVTFGAAGAQWDGLRVDGIPVPEEDVLDTTGAGDAFCGALAASLARGDSREMAMKWAMHAGANAVPRFGAQTDPEM